MAISTELKYAKLGDLYLDPMNVRLGRSDAGSEVTQEEVLQLMTGWALDEIAVSFLESGGFWSYEPLLVTEEVLHGKKCLVVVEGNRRLATLKYLKRAFNGEKAPRKLVEIAKTGKAPPSLFTKIPYIQVGSREEIESFLGFRHVTGIKEWKAAEKAAFIARLIDKRKMSYNQVTRKIGSRVDTVRRNYISYRILLQMEDTLGIPQEQFEGRFSVMYLALRTQGVRKYLDIDIHADPKTARKPVPKPRLKDLANFALWLFGDGKRLPIFSDSRQVDNFGRILESKEAIKYLERSEEPSFEVALRTASGDEPEILRLIEKAADNIELALTRTHLYKKSKKIQSAVKRLGADANQLLDIFPAIRAELEKEGG
ncbi:MAG TPA: hypothetical protein VMX13_09020 [Sedimentisphaerales bacterium]|nr:hypothetical protein [Sedimentisphaerales bacterium]